MKRLLIGMTVVVSILTLTVALYAQETDPVTIVNDWTAALNAGDVDAALSYLGDDVQITPSPGMTFTGKEEVRGWYEGLVAANSQNTLGDCTVDGENVTCDLVFTNDDFQAAGIASVDGELVLVVRDGKIRTYTFNLSPESLAALSQLPPPPQALAETGGRSLSPSHLLMALGGLVITCALLIRVLAPGVKRLSGISR
ncbi:MAG: nuclear transport factor 2 family protein [Anaerolineae bacterium]|nr:nuclear transport factor 2 family protein [Anaerolineae bacterium]